VAVNTQKPLAQGMRSQIAHRLWRAKWPTCPPSPENYPLWSTENWKCTNRIRSQKWSMISVQKSWNLSPQLIEKCRSSSSGFCQFPKCFKSGLSTRSKQNAARARSFCSGGSGGKLRNGESLFGQQLIVGSQHWESKGGGKTANGVKCSTCCTEPD
jgi:hypothetical protein